jgi:hypothetical protein
VVIGEVARLAERFAWFRSAGASTADPFADVPETGTDDAAAPLNTRSA